MSSRQKNERRREARSPLSYVSGGYRVMIEIEYLPARRQRYSWTVCSEQNPDELLSWGHAPNQDFAERAAEAEVKKLDHGLSQGGKVINRRVSATIRRSQRGETGRGPK